MNFARVLKKGKSKHKFGSRSTGRKLDCGCVLSCTNKQSKIDGLKKKKKCLNASNVIWLTGDTCIYLCVNLENFLSNNTQQSGKEKTNIYYLHMYAHA